MKSDDVVVSRRGNLVVINHNKFEIKFNLSKGTWDYIDESGDTIIRNGCTQITLGDGSVVKTEGAGTREFITASPQTDAFGVYHQICFSYESTEKGVRINTYLNCYATQPAILLKVSIENLKQGHPLQLNKLTVVGVSTNRGAVLVGADPSNCHLFITMPPFLSGVSRRLYDGFLLSEMDAKYPCPDGMLHNTENGKTLVFGFLTTRKWWPRIQIGYQGDSGSNSQSNSKKTSTSGANLWALYHLCKKQCDFGEEITSETVYLNFSGDAAACYEHYTQMLALKNDCVHSDASPACDMPITAWNFSPAQLPLDANTILAQTDELVENPLFQPNFPGGLDYIQLDTGLESFLEHSPSVEDTSKPQIADEMSTVLNQIRAKGFKTGIRINPLCATLDSELVQKHPDYCIQEEIATRRGKGRSRRRSGRNGYKPATTHLPEDSKEVALLDVSHPEVQKRIRKQIKRIVNEYGCLLVNVDFTAYTTGLTNGAQNLRWHDKTLTSVQLYRLAGELLRDAVSAARSESPSAEGEVLLAGYNAVPGPCLGNISLNAPLINPPFSSVGAVLNRTNDPWHHQRGTKHRLTRYAAHIREHNHLWRHVFGELSVDEPRPVNEAIVEMTAAALSGGTVFCTDRLTMLASSRAAYLSRIFPLLGKAATPVDLYDEPFPRIWCLPVSTPSETWYLAAIFNWNDYEDDTYFEFDVLGLGASTEYLVHDFWMRQYLGKASHGLTLLNIPPRSVKLLCFREAQSVPQLLATDMHYTQGAVEILSAGWDGHSHSYLLVCKPLRQADSTCFIHVPEGYLPVGVAAYGSTYQYKWDTPVCQLTFTKMQPDKLVQASIQFAKTSGGSSGERDL